jgi:hypothetical protein
MSACAAVRGLFRTPRAGPAFRWSETGEDATPQCGWPTRVESIRSILSQTGLTVGRLSAITGKRYGSRSPYFIPATFLYKLRSGVTPHVCQIVALSESTGYRFVDWMQMCGFDLHQIPRLQMQLHAERTVLITPIDFGPAYFVPRSSVDEAACDSSMSPQPGEARRPGSGRYLFAKVGSGDAQLCPALVPGSVVRVDRCYPERLRSAESTSLRSLLWLVEQPRGLTCCHVRWIDDRQVVLLPSRPPWGSWPLRLPNEARILGLVDTEGRPLNPAQPQPRTRPMTIAPLLPQPQGTKRMRFSDLLRISRGRSGLTFRAAQRLTGAIAQILRSRDHAIALGLLSDYEAMGRLPRHIAKIVSLCITYCMDIRELMEAAGVNIDDSAKMPLPMLNRALPVLHDFLDRAAHESTIGIGPQQRATREWSAREKFRDMEPIFVTHST